MKKKYFIILAVFILSIILLYSNNLSVEEILDKIDYNMTPETIKHEGEMRIYRSEREMLKKFISYSVGATKAYIEFTYPPRDRGTKYLRIENDLWMFLPRASRTVKISGHMLRQSMMGSDFSYEDQTENRTLREQYDAKIISEEKYEGNEVYIIELRAKAGAEPVYYMQKIWVDKEKFVYYKSELFGRSEQILKVLYLSDYQKLNDKYYPSKLKMEDKLKKDTYTSIIMSNLEIDIALPESIFSLQNLERN
jgi:outer membrane lipoprotein-sorting protein